MHLDELLPPVSSLNGAKTALIDADGRSCNYSELTTRVEMLASCLSAASVGKGHRVALIADKSIDSVVALLGILRVGAAYVPIDAYSPYDRRMSMLVDCSPTALLIDDTQGDLHLPITDLGYALLEILRLLHNSTLPWLPLPNARSTANSPIFCTPQEVQGGPRESPTHIAHRFHS